MPLNNSTSLQVKITVKHTTIMTLPNHKTSPSLTALCKLLVPAYQRETELKTTTKLTQTATPPNTLTPPLAKENILNQAQLKPGPNNHIQTLATPTPTNKTTIIKQAPTRTNMNH